jgi:hypothetical protein
MGIFQSGGKMKNEIEESLNKTVYKFFRDKTVIGPIALTFIHDMISSHLCVLARCWDANCEFDIKDENDKIIITPKNIHAVLIMMGCGEYIIKYNILPEDTEFECEEFKIKNNEITYLKPINYITVDLNIIND